MIREPTNSMFRLRLLALTFALAAVSLASPSTAADTKLTAFGHSVVVKESRTAEGSVEVDGRTLHRNWSLVLDEVAIVAGTPVLLGMSGAGGNSCEWTPFVISFPADKAPRFDGPVNTCWLVERKILSDRITFSTAAMPDSEGEKWV